MNCHILFAIVGLIAVKAADISNNIVGINWSPFHNPDYSSTTVEETLAEDFEQIANSGFDYIRTFYAAHHSQAVVVEKAVEYGLKVALGVYMYEEHSTWTTKQMTAAAEQAAAYPDDVTAIFMGNENYRPEGPFISVDGCDDDCYYTADEMVDYINDMKTLLEEYGVTDIPVCTVQRYTEWNNISDSGIQSIAEACDDIIGVNIYPFYVDSLDSIDDNERVLGNQLTNIKGNYSDKTVWMTETGFPSGGSDCSSEQETSVDKTEEYFNMIKEYADQNSDDQIFYFAYFDKETAEEQDDICNNFFGLADAYGTLKFDI